MVKAIVRTCIDLRWYLLIVLLVYLAVGTAGFAVTRGGSLAAAGLSAQDEAKYAQIEEIFGRFRQPVRDGSVPAMATVAAVVFSLNMLGSLFGFTLGGALLLPAVFNVVLGAWTQGGTLATLHASTAWSMFAFLIVVAMEWATYVLATAAGLQIAGSFLVPSLQGTHLRRRALRAALGDCGRMYALIVPVLALQAVLETLYVRQILLMGGTGIPLQPY
jgi:hypothetical protein